MLKSMTAYGQASYLSQIGRFLIEITSVNRKHLEIQTFLPKELLRYDVDIKKWIAALVARGQVNVRISVFFDKESPLVVTPNLNLSHQIIAAWEAIAKKSGLTPTGDVLLTLLSKEGGALIYEEKSHDEKLFHEALRELVSLGLKQFVLAKESEGRILSEDILMRFNKLKGAIEKIERKSTGAVNKYQAKLKEKLDEVLGLNPLNDERVMREICVYAEKIDVSEEIVRFLSHLQQVHVLIAKQESSGVGKTLEFFIQELNREANTIGSKTADVEVSHLVIEIKAELEKIREQIQNIE